MCLGIPGQIVAIINADDALATVDIAGVRRPVNIAFVMDDRSAEECIGDWVLVHVGFAMSRIDLSTGLEYIVVAKNAATPASATF